MTENRELTMDDYLGMLRRRLKVILIPTLLAPLAGFLVSYAFAPKYTSHSTVLVEGQKVPDSYVQSVITADFTQRVQTLSQEVLSPSRLRPVIEPQSRASDFAAPGLPVEFVADVMTFADAGRAPWGRTFGNGIDDQRGLEPPPAS